MGAMQPHAQPRARRSHVMAMALLTVLWCDLSSSTVRADPESDALRARGFDLAYNLDHEAAMALLRRAVEIDPADPATHRSVAAVTWLNILFRRGAVTVDHYMGKLTKLRDAGEETPPELAERFYANVDHAIELAARQVDASPTDPDAHYELGASVALRASYLATIEGKKLAGFKAARRAFDAHERVLELDPSRTDAKLVVGTYRYIVASLPFALRWIAYMAGFGGGRERGLEMVETASADESDAQTDAHFALILLYSREQRHADAVDVVRSLQRRYPRNRLIWLEAGSTELRADLAQQADATLTQGLRMLARDPRPRVPGEEALWRYKRGAARVAVGRAPEAEQDLRAALRIETPAWIRGRVHAELGKLSDLSGDRRRARTEYERAIRLCREADDPLCEKEGKALRKSGHRIPD